MDVNDLKERIEAYRDTLKTKLGEYDYEKMNELIEMEIELERMCNK